MEDYKFKNKKDDANHRIITVGRFSGSKVTPHWRRIKSKPKLDKIEKKSNYVKKQNKINNKNSPKFRFIRVGKSGSKITPHMRRIKKLN